MKIIQGPPQSWDSGLARSRKVLTFVLNEKKTWS